MKLFFFLQLVSSSYLSLLLSTGELDFSGSFKEEKGPWVVSVDETIECLWKRPLSACGSVEGYLPPHSYLIHVATNDASCLRAMKALPCVNGLVPLPPSMRISPALLKDRDPGVRVLTVRIAGASSVVDSLGESLAPHLCPECTLLLGSSGSSVVHVSSLESPSCVAARASLTSPRATGCTIPQSTISALATHPSVIWVEALPGLRLHNAFARGVLETSDAYNWGGVVNEFGACSGGDAECSQGALLPLAQISSLFGPLAPASNQLSDPVGLTASTSCGSVCRSAACGNGFATCNDINTPLATSSGLTGADQLVQIVDSGVDIGSPFFVDSRVDVPPPTPFTDPASPASVTLTTHRKIPLYWAYADGIDGGYIEQASSFVRGHGTHCAGSISGTAVQAGSSDMKGFSPAPLVGLPALRPGEEQVLSAATGVAPGARLFVTDVGCDARGGCERGPVTPQRSGACDFAQVCFPNNRTELFAAALRAGAKISSNSWGSSSPGDSTYTAESEGVDSFVWFNPEFLPIFPTGDFGARNELVPYAVAKNSLTVGGLSDGLLGHIAKTGAAPAYISAPRPALYQSLAGRACGGILSFVRSTSGQALNLQGLGPGGVCPSTPPTPSQCYSMTRSSQGIDTSSTPFGGFPTADPSTPVPFLSPYAFGTISDCDSCTVQTELALCCGCTLASIIAGCQTSGDCSDSTFLSTLLKGLTTVYNARVLSPSTSKGPSGDNRIKVGVKASFRRVAPRASFSTHNYTHIKPSLSYSPAA